ncbi:tripartite motif-containing protein 59-like [Mizuhopecten yessoensis]|uniref:tripartite motif-containing protein 59-like n=1 Tax=Mizuhopecten yessoensis TaxID=6573 RepID=UPI000B45EC7F|nr:tripartite motif-containing protein 59-like [Mizuhopecten yessoensis]
MDEEQRKAEEKRRQLEEETLNIGTSNNIEELVKPKDVADRKRNLVFDEERFEDTFLKCLICRENFDDTEKAPKMLPCHHTFCLDCLRQMFRVEGEFRQNLSSAFRAMPMAVKICCPSCREALILSDAEIVRLPNDHTVLELLSFVRSTGKKDVQYCTKHKMQPLNFFCEPCILPVCCDCTVIDHKEKNGHRVMNVEEALDKYTPVIDETLADLQSAEQTLLDKRQSLEKSADNIEQIQRELAVQIRQTFDRLRDAIDERERELFKMSESEIDRKRGEIDEQLQIVQSREESVTAEKDRLNSAREDKNISAMFSTHQTARETLEKKVHIPGPSPSSKDFAVSFQFNSRQENVIKASIAGLGDVSFKMS